jgi:hypothetical protein
MISKSSAGGVLLNRRYRSVVVAVIVGVFLAMVVPVAVDASTPRGSSAGGPQISWTACGPQLECASVPVPLDWAHPGGPTIALSVIRHLATIPLT